MLELYFRNYFNLPGNLYKSKIKFQGDDREQLMNKRVKLSGSSEGIHFLHWPR